MQLRLHKQLSNQELGQVLSFISGVIALKEGNSFRARAYQNAAVAIEQYPKQLQAMFLTDADFDQIPGVGETLQQKLTELFTTGTIKAFERYVADLPAGMWPLFHLSGIGAKKAFRLATTFHLIDESSAVAKLLAAAQAGKIRELPGFGAKSEQEMINILQSAQPTARLPYAEAKKVADQMIKALKACHAIAKIELLGSLRRQTTTVGDVDLGIAVTDMAAVKAFVQTMPMVKRVMVAGEQLIRVQLQDDHQVDIKVSTPAEWGAFLQHFTGSKEHNIKLRELALKQGKSLSEHGIKFMNKPGQEELAQPYADEVTFYAELGFDFIPPAERVGGPELVKYRR
jgi:DNA polymerase (family 10)